MSLRERTQRLHLVVINIAKRCLRPRMAELRSRQVQALREGAAAAHAAAQPPTHAVTHAAHTHTRGATR